MEKIPEAAGTRQMVKIIQCVVDSYMDKTLDPLQRIEKIWYALFFLRYWRNWPWVTVHPMYEVQKHFITSNAFKCVELNAHALIIALMTARENFEGHACFLPWILGSQCCEQAFRSVRSMSSIFSTPINFGMLGLLRRLHHLDIISSLQANSDDTGIKFPAPAKWKCQQNNGATSEVRTSFQCFTDGKIQECIEKALKSAKVSIENMGMRRLLEKHKLWDSFKNCKETDNKNGIDEKQLEDDENDDDDDDENAIVNNATDEEVTHLMAIEKDINILSRSNLAGQQSIAKIQNCLKKFSGTPITMFPNPSDDHSQTLENDNKHSKVTPFVLVKVDDTRDF